MDSKRQSHKNKIFLEIKELENIIVRNEDTIKRLKSSNIGGVFSLTQIEKLTKIIDQKTILLEKLRQDDLDIMTGKLDDIINEQYEKNKSINDKKVREKKASTASKIEDNKKKKDTSDTYWKGMISENRALKQTERAMNYELKHFYKVVDSVPSYIYNNLSEMPNNKGYIWRGMYLYGHLPAEEGPIVMFEKFPNSLLIIHEYTKTEYKKYEKQGQNRKVCILRKIRKEKKCGNSLGDFLTLKK